MAQLLNLESGQVEVVPDEQVSAAVGSGRFSLPKSERVEVVDADGQRGTIAPEDAAEAFAKRGYRFVGAKALQSEKDAAEFGDRPVAAFAAGVGRGATFGLSDVALAKTGLVEDRTLQGLEEHNPGASMGGELTGTILPALIPGGQLAPAGAAARVGTAVAERLGGKVAAKVAGGVAEQALFSAGNLVSEAALGRPEVNGEKLLGEAGLSLLLGVGGAAVGELGAAALHSGGKRVAVEGAEAVADAVAGRADDVAEAAAKGAADAAPSATESAEAAFAKPLLDVVGEPSKAKQAAAMLEGEVEKRAGTVKGILQDLGLDVPTAEKWVLRDLDLTKSQVNKLRDSKFGDLDVSAPRALLDDARYAEAKTLGQKVKLIETKQEEAGKAIGEAMDRFDAVAEPGLRPNYPDVARKIREEMIAPRSKGISVLESPIVKRLEEIAAEIETKPGTTFREAEELKRSLDPFLKWDSQTEAPMKDALQQLRGILNGEIESKAAALSKKVGDDTFAKWKDAKRLYAGMTELSDKAAEREMARSAGNRFLSLTDNLAGGAALAAGGLNPVGLAMSAGAAVLNKWGRERLPHLIALWMKRAESGATGKAAAGLKLAVEDALKKAPATVAEAAAAGAGGVGEAAQAAAPEVSGAFGRYSKMLSDAAARGAPALFALHAALSASDPEYRDEMVARGMPNTPEVGAAGERHSERLDALEKRTRALDSRLDGAIDGLLNKRPSRMGDPLRFGGGKGGKARLEEFNRRATELAQLATNPQALVERLAGASGDLGDAAPATTAAMMAAAQRAVAFLHEQAPKAPPSALDIPALRRNWQPTDAELAKWERMVAAVESPGGVLEDMAAGTVTKEAIQALQAVYPNLYDDAKNRALERLATHPSTLDYQQRLRLGSLLGTALDDTAKPERVARLQATFAQPEQKPQPAGGGSVKGLGDLAANEMAGSDRLLSRR